MFEKEGKRLDNFITHNSDHSLVKWKGPFKFKCYYSADILYLSSGFCDVKRWAPPCLCQTYASISGNWYQSQERNEVLQLGVGKQRGCVDGPHECLPPIVISESFKKILCRKVIFFQTVLVVISAVKAIKLCTLWLCLLLFIYSTVTLAMCI